MSTSAKIQEKTEIREDDVVEYLRSHPEFFVEHEDLLEDLRLPHHSGTAISLVQRQISLFREQRDRYEHQLLELVDIARQNDRFFEKSKRLLLNLMEARTLDEALIVLEDSFLEDFTVDYCSLMLFVDGSKLGDSQVQTLNLSRAREVLGNRLDHHKAQCGAIDAEEAQLLFPKQADAVKSAAIIPLHTTELLGVLSIGSEQGDYFDRAMGSLFLSYISECLSRLLPGLIRQAQQTPSAVSS